MNNQEQQRVEKVSEWYLKDQLDFDRRLIQFRYQTLRPHLAGPEGLELGPAEGEMTQFLLPHFTRLTVVDGSQELLARINDAPNLVKVHKLFEEFVPDQPFNTIVMEHILEHVEDPVSLVSRVKEWLARGGKLLVGVPNAHSIHRLAAVKMGLLKEPCELNARDRILGHRRVYTPESFRRDLETAGVQVVEKGGVFFKPLSNQQIQDNWTEEMIAGFYELGKDFPDYAAELYAICQSA
ncbi:MAG: class I SAM-dependent methyltransferase [Acidobacteria bacterium]|nr:MAG: class I SAM-dependent methyltransferase [Acidobacteriota bacterium]